MHARCNLLFHEAAVQEWEVYRDGAEVCVDKLVEEVTRRQLQADGWQQRAQKFILST